jgi:hypothetical protein
MRGWLPVLFVVAIAACGSKPPPGPAWPAASTTADDGGESIDPHPTAVATSIESSKDDDEDEKPADQPEIVAKPGAAVSEPSTPATVSPPTPVTDDVIMSEEIIIEIED